MIKNSKIIHYICILQRPKVIYLSTCHISSNICVGIFFFKKLLKNSRTLIFGAVSFNKCIIYLDRYVSVFIFANFSYPQKPNVCNEEYSVELAYYLGRSFRNGGRTLKFHFSKLPVSEVKLQIILVRS